MFLGKNVPCKKGEKIKKDKDMAANDFLSYDKIRWPCFKDMVLR